jgi:hypothetical protein
MSIFVIFIEREYPRVVWLGFTGYAMVGHWVLKGQQRKLNAKKVVSPAARDTRAVGSLAVL